GFSNLTKMFVGAGQNCGIRGDGLLFCWGAGTTGQIGDGGLSNRLTPTLVPGMNGIVDMGLGSGHSCALRGDGAVFCWGTGALWGSSDEFVDRFPSPTQVPGITDATQIAS